jgi:hypothetical protein
MKNLIVLCADKKIENTIDALLGRPAALRIRQINYDIKVHANRDPGCFHYAHSFLKPLRLQYDHALVVFDRDWDGAPSQSAEALEDAVNTKLKADWGDKAASVVISPELEAWVWSDSPHVESELGWPSRLGGLRRWLEGKGLWSTVADKPADPKKAVEAATREAKVPWTAAVCRGLASNVSVDRCTDGAFQKLKAILNVWFGGAPDLTR